MRKARLPLPILLLSTLWMLTVPPRAHALVMSVDGGLSWGVGNAGQSNGEAPSRLTQALTLYAFPAAAFDVVAANRPLTLKTGVLVQYTEGRQIADPGDFGNHELRGSSFAFGLGVRALLAPFSVFVGYDLMGWGTFPNPRPGYSDVTYSWPHGPVLGAGYNISRSFAVEVVLRTLTYARFSYSDPSGLKSSGELGDAAFRQNSLGLGGRITF